MSSNDIRKILMDEIKNIQTGKTELKTSRVLVKAAAQIIYADRLTMEEKVHQLKMKKYVKSIEG